MHEFNKKQQLKRLKNKKNMHKWMRLVAKIQQCRIVTMWRDCSWPCLHAWDTSIMGTIEMENSVLKSVFSHIYDPQAFQWKTMHKWLYSKTNLDAKTWAQKNLFSGLRVQFLQIWFSHKIIDEIMISKVTQSSDLDNTCQLKIHANWASQRYEKVRKEHCLEFGRPICASNLST